MSRVARLPPTLANQIAAGEVVERPASVVKELVENSLDAGARRVEVEAERGGAKLLRVRDDGAGIHRDDLPLALERHATSKIAALEDLERIATMGFRGEALPSIASVSRFALESCVEGADSGWSLSVDGGEVAPLAPCAHPVGTTATVRDLFFNTPARRKFLRTDKTEMRHVEDVVRRVALARFDVAVHLSSERRTVWSLPAADGEGGRLRRLGRLCGRDFVDHAIEVDLGAEGMRLRGWLGGPGHGRAHADVQHFFVNGRMVSDQVARHALRVAVAEQVPAGRHAAYVLFLELDPGEVDVNVHPTKHEVRYREARLVHDFIHRGLERELSGSTRALLEPAATTAASPSPHAPARGMTAPQPGTYAAYRALRSGVAEPSVRTGDGVRATAIGTRYLAVQRGPTFEVVDLERARRHWLARRLAGLPEGTVDARPFLLPATREVGEPTAERLEAAMEQWAAAGFDLRRTGPETMSLRRAPVVLENLGAGAQLAAIAAHGGAGGPPASLLERVVAGCDVVADWVDGPDDVRHMLSAIESAPAGVCLTLDDATLETLFRRARGG